jgi:hypothetical protein
VPLPPLLSRTRSGSAFVAAEQISSVAGRPTNIYPSWSAGATSDSPATCAVAFGIHLPGESDPPRYRHACAHHAKKLHGNRISYSHSDVSSAPARDACAARHAVCPDTELPWNTTAVTVSVGSAQFAGGTGLFLEAICPIIRRSVGCAHAPGHVC